MGSSCLSRVVTGGCVLGCNAVVTGQDKRNGKSTTDLWETSKMALCHVPALGVDLTMGGVSLAAMPW